MCVNLCKFVFSINLDARLFTSYYLQAVEEKRII